MLKPISLQPSLLLVGSGFPPTHTPQYGKADSVTPTFSWEAFPSPYIRYAGGPEFLKRISDVAYDLKVWKGLGGLQSTLTYEREGFDAPIRAERREIAPDKLDAYGQPTGKSKPEIRIIQIASHEIETPLDPASTYYWSVRARFKLDGKTRFTTWSHYAGFSTESRYGESCSGRITGPGTAYYRFKTPALPVDGPSVKSVTH